MKLVLNFNILYSIINGKIKILRIIKYKSKIFTSRSNNIKFIPDSNLKNSKLNKL